MTAGRGRPSKDAEDVTERPTERTNLTVAFVGVTALCLAIAWPIFSGEIYTDTDLGNFHLPMRFFYAEALSQGFDFHWFPYEYTGFHLHGEGQASLYHPLNWLMYRVLPLDVAFMLDILRNYVFLIAGGWLCLRRFGLRRDAALLGAALFAFGSFSTMHFMHLNAMAIVAHIPWKLWVIDVALRSQRRDRVALAVVALSAMTASQLLFGHPQFTWLSLLIEGVFTSYMWWQGVGRRRWPWLLFAQLLAFVLAAVQLWPQWETLAISHRSDPGLDFAYSLSLRPVNLLQIVSPLFFRARAVGGAEATEFAVYSGALVPVLLAWLAVRGRALGALGRAAAVALGLAVFGLLMALGDRGPIYWIQGELPGLSLFRGPSRYIGVAQFGLAFAAAFAFVDLARTAEAGGLKSTRRGLWLFAPLVLAGVVCVLGFVRPFPEDVAFEVSGPWRLGYGLAAVAIFTLLAWLAARGTRLALPLMLGLALLDLGVYGLAWIRREPPMPLEQFIHNRTIPDWTDRHRLHWGPPALSMRHVRLVSGYAAMVPKKRLRTDRYQLGRRPPQPEMLVALRLAGVGWAYGRPVPDPLPRVRLVSAGVRAHNLQKQLLAIDPVRTAIVHGDVTLGGGEPGSTLVLDDLPGELRVEASAEGRQLLVFAESHHPGWRGRVDGEEVEVFRVYGDFMGVAVPGGVHTVELRFEPESVRQGRMVSLLGMGLMGPLYFVTRRFCGAEAEEPGAEDRSKI